jgi:hypothetical protein
VHFYLYILHFLMWQRSRSANGEAAILSHIKRCKELAMYRRDYCYEWLALEPSWCSIIDHASLGKMEPVPKGARRTELFKDSTRLARISGTTVPGFERQGGSLKLGGRITAFFVPGDNLYAYKDQQREVNFFLGFSHEGLRAWLSSRELPMFQSIPQHSPHKFSLRPPPKRLPRLPLSLSSTQANSLHRNSAFWRNRSCWKSWQVRRKGASAFPNSARNSSAPSQG